jgi:hypothetical protein
MDTAPHTPRAASRRRFFPSHVTGSRSACRLTHTIRQAVRLNCTRNLTVDCWKLGKRGCELTRMAMPPNATDDSSTSASDATALVVAPQGSRPGILKAAEGGGGGGGELVSASFPAPQHESQRQFPRTAAEAGIGQTNARHLECSIN